VLSVCPGRKVRVFRQAVRYAPVPGLSPHVSPSNSVAPVPACGPCGRLATCQREGVIWSPRIPAGDHPPKRVRRERYFRVKVPARLPGGPRLPGRPGWFACPAVRLVQPSPGRGTDVKPRRKLVSDLRRYRRHATVVQGFIARRGKCPTCPCGGRLRRGVCVCVCVCAWCGRAIVGAPGGFVKSSATRRKGTARECLGKSDISFAGTAWDVDMSDMPDKSGESDIGDGAHIVGRTGQSVCTNGVALVSGRGDPLRRTERGLGGPDPRWIANDPRAVLIGRHRRFRRSARRFVTGSVVAYGANRTKGILID
jgi:hypothetical protein